MHILYHTERFLSVPKSKSREYRDSLLTGKVSGPAGAWTDSLVVEASIS
jgi:hypothetical protein